MRKAIRGRRGIPRAAGRKRRAAIEQFELWQLGSLEWDYTAGFGVSGSRFDEGPWSELSIVTLRGPVVWPENTRYGHATLTIYGKRKLDDTEPRDGSPNFIGLVEAKGDELHVSAFVPFDRAHEFLTVAASGRFCSAQFFATSLRHRKAMVHSVQLSTEAAS
jgi:hypothetical protein